MPVAALCATLCGCPRPGGPTAANDPRPEAAKSAATVDGHAPPPAANAQLVIDRAAHLLESLAGAVTVAGGDCEKLARATNDWLDAHEEELAEISVQAVRIPEPERAALMRTAVDFRHVEATAVLEQCARHPGTAAARRRLQRAMSPVE